jgi:hypothetical protein
MGQFSAEKPAAPGSALSGDQQREFVEFAAAEGASVRELAGVSGSVRRPDTSCVSAIGNGGQVGLVRERFFAQWLRFKS